jgi:hypothetical protein
MTKDKALDLALEALGQLWLFSDEAAAIANPASTAIKQARSAPVQEPDLIARLKHPEHYYDFTDPKKANSVLMSLCQEAADALAAPMQEPAKDNSNYRLDPPGLDPADGTQVSKVWWDGEKLMAKPIPLVDFYQPMQDSTCSETLRAQGKAYPRTCRKCGKGPCIGAPKQSPAAQRQWTGLTDDERNKLWRDVVKWGDPSHDDVDLIKAIEAKLKEKNHDAM